MLVAFQFFMILAARSLELSGRFQLLEAVMPAFMSQWTNMAAASFAGFVLFGYSHPLVQLFLVATAIGIGSEPAAEIDTKFVDLLMSRPLRAKRPSIARSSCFSGDAWRGGLHARRHVERASAVCAGVGARSRRQRGRLSGGQPGLPRAGLGRPDSGARVVFATPVDGRRDSRLLAFAMSVLDYVGRFWDAVAPVARVSPFHYFDPFGIMGGQPLAVSNVVTLLGVFVVGAVFANIAYARRDL